MHIMHNAHITNTFTSFFMSVYLQAILNMIGRFLPREPKVNRRCRHDGKARKHCMRCNPGKWCIVYNVLHYLVLSRPAIRRAIGLSIMATVCCIICTLEAPVGATCHHHPKLLHGAITMPVSYEHIRGHMTVNCLSTMAFQCSITY